MRAYLLCLLISVFPAAAHAELVQQLMRPGIPASAEYRVGERGKPAVLLHGFLQTRALVNQSLSFCRKHPSTPEGLLSYVRWDQERVLASLKQVRVSTQLIMGDSDEMMGGGWLQALQHVQAPVVIVKGANHFMSGEHEFDLLENALKYLDAIKLPAPR
jgi:hypothetical protein